MLPDHLGLRAGADLLLDLHADGLEVEPHLLQHVDGDALAELDQAEQKMLGADVVVVEAVGFLAGQRQDLLGAGGKIIHRLMASAAAPLPDSLTSLLISVSGTTFKRSRIISARRRRAPRRCSFRCEALLQMRRLGVDEQFVDR